MSGTDFDFEVSEESLQDVDRNFLKNMSEVSVQVSCQSSDDTWTFWFLIIMLLLFMFIFVMTIVMVVRAKRRRNAYKLVGYM